MADYKNPNKVNPLKSKAFKGYLWISMGAIFVIVAFVAFVWLAGGRQRGVPDEIDFIQLETPADSAPVVVFETNIGTVKAALYPDEVPEYYHYFKSLVDSGYYDGTYITAVVGGGAYALGGTKSPDPEADYYDITLYEQIKGTGAEDEMTGIPSDMTQLKAEVSDNLWPIKGALCSFVGSSLGRNYAGSTFIFVGDVTAVNEAYMDEGALKRAYGEELGAVFSEQGGVPNFSMKYTVFAQVYDGWDVYSEILAAETLSSSQPASDIVFEKVYISTYGEEK